MRTIFETFSLEYLLVNLMQVAPVTAGRGVREKARPASLVACEAVFYQSFSEMGYFKHIDEEKSVQ
jgi:hypothetical protein